MANGNDELQELKRQVALLTARVNALENAATPSLQRKEPSITVAEVPATVVAPPPRPSSNIPSGSTRPKQEPVSSSLESKIGAQWLNRIGIVAVLTGVSYFLKYAFDNRWIGPSGRIAIGLIAGIAVIVWSEWFRNRGHRIFSYSLKAVGIGVLYLSLWAAFQMYQLVPASVAFLAMVLVTAFTVVLALRQDAEIIAAFAVAGGFTTPLLLSTGQNREIELFSYIVLLDLGTLILIAFRPWKRLLLGSFVGTVILFVGWYAAFYSRPQLARTLVFATIFFGFFSAAPLLSRNKLSSTHRFAGHISTTLITVAFANALVYFFQLVALFDDFPRHQQQSLLAWSALIIAAIYLFLSRELRRQTPTTPDKSELMPLLHIAIATGFLTVAVPLKLDTHWITIGWLVEAAVLLWISQRTNTALLRYFGGAALILAIARLLMFDNFFTQRLFFNARFFTYAVAIAVLAGILKYAGNDPKYQQTARIVTVALNVLALLGLNFEVRDFFSRRLYGQDFTHYTPNPDWRQTTLVRDFTYSALWMAYGAGLMAVGFWRRSSFLRWQALVLIAITIGKVFVYDVWQLEKGYRILSFIVLGVLLLGISFAYQRDWLKLSDNRNASPRRTNSASA